MPIFVVRCEQITGNRFINEERITSVYFNDTLTFCAPAQGKYGRAVSVEADNISDAVEKGLLLFQQKLENEKYEKIEISFLDFLKRKKISNPRFISENKR